jgi:Flp pilus assembly protein protease CpaA
MIFLIQQAILFIGTLLGAVTDARTGYIFDWITYPMLFFGLIFALLSFQLFNLLSGALLFMILLISYKFGKVGGGDVKLFTAIAFLNPFSSVYFLLTLFVFSSLSAVMFYSIYYSVKYARKGIDWKREKKNILNAGFLAIFLLIYFHFMLIMGLISGLFLFIIALPLFCALLFIAFQKGIKLDFFEKKVSLKDLGDDEIIGEKNSEKLKKLLKGKSLLGEKEISKLRINNIRQVYVLRNLPKFGPFIFIGTIIAFYFPNLLQIILF